MEKSIVESIATIFIDKEHKGISSNIKELKKEVSNIREAINLKDLTAKVDDTTLYFTGEAKGYVERKTRNHKYEVYDARFGEDSKIDCHAHKEEEIFILIRGTVKITINDIEHTLKAGDFCTAGAKEVHCLEFTEDSRIITVAIPALSEFIDE